MRLAVGMPGRRTPLRRWLSDVWIETRALSLGRRLVLAASGLGTLAFAIWLALLGARAIQDGLAGARAVPIVRGAGSLLREDDDRHRLEAELQRGIEALAPVESARVQLPPRDRFAGAAEPGSASVVLGLRDGKPLDGAELQGIQQLVAASLYGLSAADVSVLDASGRLLSAAPLSRDLAAVPAHDLDREARFEQALAARTESLLALTAGAGRVAVRVRAELDWSRREETRERYDPDGQVERSEDRTTEPASGGRSGATTGRSSERVEYDVGKQVTRAITPAGAVKRLHVAVLVDGKPDAGDRAGSGYTPWSAPELAQLESLAKQAVGFSAERGDELTLTSAPFQADATLGPETVALLAEGLRAVALLAGLAVLAFVALRALGDGPAVAGLPMSAAELEAALLGASGLPGVATMPRGSGSLPLAEEIARAVRPAADRDAGAAALRAWLSER
jgi:flagellar M-ring protein FliF